MFLLGGARLFEEPREKLTGADLLDLEETRQSREKAMIIYIYGICIYIYIPFPNSLVSMDDDGYVAGRHPSPK